MWGRGVLNQSQPVSVLTRRGRTTVGFWMNLTGVRRFNYRDVARVESAALALARASGSADTAFKRRRRGRLTACTPRKRSDPARTFARPG